MSAGPVMIMAGGTGGHVFPGLAVAEVLRTLRHPVVWLGTHQGLEARVVPGRGIEVQWISIGGIRGRGLLAWLVAPFRIGLAITQALAALRRSRPSVVLGMGGFVSGPGGIAAWLTRRPLVIHEQNAVAGTTNRLLARFARRVFEGFTGSFPSGVAAETIGNPVRSSIVSLTGEPRPASAAGPRRLLVLGGSQGALALNRLVPEALANMPTELRPVVRHQAGRTLDETRAAYERCGVDAQIYAFIDAMDEAYEWADIVVARAGALTIAELQVAGRAAILVPYPYAIDGHQMRNAEHFVERGGGILLPQDTLTAETLGAVLADCLGAPERIHAMSRSARAQAKPDAAEVLARACLELAEATP